VLLLCRQAELNVQCQSKDFNFPHSLPISYRYDKTTSLEGFAYLFVAYLTTLFNPTGYIEEGIFGKLEEIEKLQSRNEHKRPAETFNL
jgi:hypothetical protein